MRGIAVLSAINLWGKALTPAPAIAVNFRSFDTGCGNPVACTAEIADTVLRQGQGMHGSFSRADTMNVMAAAGPDFKRGFADPAPVSNADIGRTLARLLGLTIADRGRLVGRVLTEAVPGGELPKVAVKSTASLPDASGLATRLSYQQVGGTRYFDAAGFAGRTVGLPAPAAASAPASTAAK